MSIADSVIRRGTVDAFLRGYNDGVEYGRWDCQWRSQACPLAPERLALAPPPRIDASLQPAWDALRSSVVWPMFNGVGNVESVRVRWGTVPARHDGRYTFGVCHRSTHTITKNEAFRGERPEALAAALAHELWHAASYISYPRDFSACVSDEVLAFVLQGLAWLSFDLWPTTDLEHDHFQVLLRVSDDFGGDFDDDVSDWPTLRAYVLNDLNYRQTCAA